MYRSNGNQKSVQPSKKKRMRIESGRILTGASDIGNVMLESEHLVSTTKFSTRRDTYDSVAPNANRNITSFDADCFSIASIGNKTGTILSRDKSI